MAAIGEGYEVSDEEIDAFSRGFGRGLAEALIENKRECSAEWGEGYHGVSMRLSAHLCSLGAGHAGEHICYCGQEHDGVGVDV